MTDKSKKIRRSQFNSAIDYASLKLELEDALRADQLYRLRNDAKLRAVDQNVPTYDHFRQMVNAAHLRPLQRDDWLFRAKEGSSWNPVAVNDHSEPKTHWNSIVRNQEERRADIEQIESTDIVTCEQFTRGWKAIQEHAARFRYLESFKYDNYRMTHLSRNIQLAYIVFPFFSFLFFFSRDLFVQKIFRSEIPSPLFAELMDVCSEAVAQPTDNIENVVEILSVMSRCNRFSLTINFMGEKEKSTCRRLFDRLIERARDRHHFLVDAIESLRITYGLRNNPQAESSI
ncbi:dynein axonemal assembly factor 19 isoform X1 [Halictus rubicundus]|uniref:dynein axonemal assembly factor 19 isoform X1 n=1 Tax=Halictus rubicundus TaxID=77578 RepID=UPI004035927B